MSNQWCVAISFTTNRVVGGSPLSGRTVQSASSTPPTRYAAREGEYFNYQKAWVAPTSDYAAATSPMNFVERIRVPTLHAYGENDARVEFKQWRELRGQLDKFHKPYTAIVEAEQGHGFRTGARFSARNFSTAR